MDGRIQDWKESSGKWREEEAYKGSNETDKHSKIAEQIQILKKIAGNSLEE